ncbi:hypothetical protein [Natronorubrum texcoconense]|nr:hypothetical protein [Natronorubrum texcoconense]
MSTELERAEQQISGEPVVTDHGEKTCDRCVHLSMLRGGSAEYDRETPITEGDQILAFLWRRDTAGTDDEASVPMAEYTVMSLYHQYHYENECVSVNLENDYHQIVVSATVDSATLEGEEYDTDLLLTARSDEQKYLVFDDLEEVMYSSAS